MRASRRDLLAQLLLVPPAALLLPTHGSAAGSAAEPVLQATPACGDPADATPTQTAGPYYRAGAPARRDLRTDIPRGEPIVLAGHVVDTRCRPVPGALVEIWHADDAGQYDESGFRLRAQQHADAGGRWGFETIVTRHYARRTAHYHFRVTAPGAPPLVTQLYFPDEPRNARDGLFNPRLLMRMTPPGGAPRTGRYDFVLAAVSPGATSR